MVPMQNSNSNSNSSSSGNSKSDPTDTPVSKMANLEVKSKTKRAKLASSKSLTQLVPRSLFFMKKNETNSNYLDDELQSSKTKKPVASKLVTCRSFPAKNVTTTTTTSNEGDQDIFPRFDETPESNNIEPAEFDLTPEICDRMDRLKAWPRLPSAHNTLRSKIFGTSSEQQQQQQQKKQQPDQDTTKTTIHEGSENALGIIFNPVKSRFLFMRGNKFVQPRCRSKQPFAKLTNELATPSPTKLYSPFGIETPDTEKAKVASKSKRKLDLGGGGGDSSKDGKKQKTPDRTNLSRAAQLRQQQSKDFKNFVSPTGKFRETVNYVEQSQRDIEAISKAIMTRARR